MFLHNDIFMLIIVYVEMLQIFYSYYSSSGLAGTLFIYSSRGVSTAYNNLQGIFYSQRIDGIRTRINGAVDPVILERICRKLVCCRSINFVINQEHNKS